MITFKRLMFIIMMTLGLSSVAQSQDITGKWKCSKGTLEQLGPQYKYLRGHCKFKKDGTFMVKLNSTTEVPAAYSFSIKVAGTYTTDGNTISTHVDRNGVYCNAPNDMPSPYIENKEQKNSEYYRTQNLHERMYDVAKGVTELREDSREAELIHDWNWDKEKIELSGKTLVIRNKARLRK